MINAGGRNVGNASPQPSNLKRAPHIAINALAAINLVLTNQSTAKMHPHRQKARKSEA